MVAAVDSIYEAYFLVLHSHRLQAYPRAQHFFTSVTSQHLIQNLTLGECQGWSAFSWLRATISNVIITIGYHHLRQSGAQDITSLKEPCPNDGGRWLLWVSKCISFVEVTHEFRTHPWGRLWLTRVTSHRLIQNSTQSECLGWPTFSWPRATIFIRIL